MGPIPDDIAVVLPIRFPKSSADHQPMAFGRSFGEDIEAKLMNDFSVTILDVPVKGQVKIEDVATRCNKLRRSSDPLVSHVSITWLCNLNLTLIFIIVVVC